MGKVVMMGVMAVFLAIPLRKDKQEFSVLLILVSCLAISTLALWKIKDILGYLQSLLTSLGSGGIYLKILLKMVGITYMAEFGSNLCRDAGYSAVAGQIEFYGKLLLLGVSLPVLTALLELLENFS
jgi:stage III sporulation protein AD